MRQFGGALLIAAVSFFAQGSPAAAAEQTGLCGRVNAYNAPTTTAPGSLTIGTRTVTIAPGNHFYPSTPVPPPERGVICVRGEMNAAGEFVSVLAVAPLHGPRYPQCGDVLSFRPASSTSAGQIVLGSVPGHVVRTTLSVPVGTVLPADSGTGHRCFTQSLDAGGDLQVTDRDLLEEGRTGPRSGSETLPFTSTSPSGREGLGVAAGLVSALAIVLLSVHAYTTRKRPAHR